jgi:type I restriction enzyme S subunit
MKIVEEKKVGFKKTKIGWIPNDWEIKKIKKITKVITGSTPPTKEPLYYGNDYFFVSPADLGSNKYILQANKKLSELGFKVSRNIPKGSILFTCIGSTIGKTGISMRDLTANQQINAILPSNNHNSEYVYYEVNRLAPKIKFLASEQAVPMINKTEFESNYITFPPLQEQEKIASILSDWDVLIENTNTLIEKLQLRKKGLMQQLLTGKTRLAGFSDEWNEQRIGNYFIERKETGYDKLKLLSVGRNGVYPQDSEKKDTSNSNKSKYKRICIGDIGYNTMRMWQGRSALSSIEGIVSPAYTILKPKANADSIFFSYLFKLDEMIHKFYRNSQGMVSDTWMCKFKDLSIVKFQAPPTNEEQIAISNILKNTDQEIDKQKEYLDQLEKQKKGLMQQLLTGKIRVN